MEEPVPCGRDMARRGGPEATGQTLRVRRAKEGTERVQGARKRASEAKRKMRMHNGSEKQSETYELILIGGDSGEYGLREYEGLVRLLLKVHDRLRRARVRPLHQVDPRLVLVHGVQDQLQIIATYHRRTMKRRDEFANKRATVNARFSKATLSSIPLISVNEVADRSLTIVNCTI